MNHRIKVITAAGITAALLTGCAYAATAGTSLVTSVSPSPAVVSTPVPPAHTAPVETSPGKPPSSRPVSASPVSPSTTPTSAASVEPTAPQPTPPVVETSTPAPVVETASTRAASVKPTPTPTATPEPVAESGPTGTRWTTSNLNIRTTPDGNIIKTAPTGSALELTGVVQGAWSEVDGGWVATRYLTSTKPQPKPKPKPVEATKTSAASKPAESAEDRCARIWKAAQKYVAAPAGASLTCAPTPDGTDGLAVWQGARYSDGTYVASSLVAMLNPSYLARATDQYAVALAVHELTHLRYDAASRDAQREAARIMGVTPAAWRDGPYTSRATERLAQGGAVCTGATSNWGEYTQTSCSTVNAALEVLR